MPRSGKDLAYCGRSYTKKLSKFRLASFWVCLKLFMQPFGIHMASMPQKRKINISKIEIIMLFIVSKREIKGVKSARHSSTHWRIGKGAAD